MSAVAEPLITISPNKRAAVNLFRDTLECDDPLPGLSNASIFCVNRLPNLGLLIGA